MLPIKCVYVIVNAIKLMIIIINYACTKNNNKIKTDQKHKTKKDFSNNISALVPARPSKVSRGKIFTLVNLERPMILTLFIFKSGGKVVLVMMRMSLTRECELNSLSQKLCSVPVVATNGEKGSMAQQQLGRVLTMKSDFIIVKTKRIYLKVSYKSKNENSSLPCTIYSLSNLILIKIRIEKFSTFSILHWKGYLVAETTKVAVESWNIAKYDVINWLAVSHNISDMRDIWHSSWLTEDIYSHTKSQKPNYYTKIKRKQKLEGDSSSIKVKTNMSGSIKRIGEILIASQVVRAWEYWFDKITKVLSTPPSTPTSEGTDTGSDVTQTHTEYVSKEADMSSKQAITVSEDKSYTETERRNLKAISPANVQLLIKKLENLQRQCPRDDDDTLNSVFDKVCKTEQRRETNDGLVPKFDGSPDSEIVSEESAVKETQVVEDKSMKAEVSNNFRMDQRGYEMPGFRLRRVKAVPDLTKIQQDLEASE